MKKTLSLLIILTTILSAETTLKKNIFQLGAVLSKTYQYAGTFSYDRLLNSGTFSIGLGVDASYIVPGDYSVIAPGLRIGFYPLNLIGITETKTKIPVTPYLLFTPLTILYEEDNINGGYNNYNLTGFYLGFRFTLSKNIGLWTEVGRNSDIRGAGGLLIQF